MSEKVKSPTKKPSCKKITSLYKKVRKASESKDKDKKGTSKNDNENLNSEQALPKDGPASPTKSIEDLGQVFDNVAEITDEIPEENAEKTESGDKGVSKIFKKVGKVAVKTALKSATGSDEAGDLICSAMESDNTINLESVKHIDKDQAKNQALFAAKIVGKIAVKSAKVALDLDDSNGGSTETDETSDVVVNAVGNIVGKTAKAALSPFAAPITAVVETGSVVTSAVKSAQ